MYRIVAAVALVATFILSPVTAVLAEGPALVTFSGAVSQSNRDPVTDEAPGVFTHNGISFDKGYAFDYEALAALPQTRYESDGPGTEGTYGGPLLMDLLDWVGATGDRLTLTGLDGYQVEIERSEVRQHQPILAITRNGQPMAIGGLGPAKIQFPKTGDADTDKKLESQSVWGLFSIEIR